MVSAIRILVVCTSLGYGILSLECVHCFVFKLSRHVCQVASSEICLSRGKFQILFTVRRNVVCHVGEFLFSCNFEFRNL